MKYLSLQTDFQGLST